MNQKNYYESSHNPNSNLEQPYVQQPSQAYPQQNSGYGQVPYPQPQQPYPQQQYQQPYLQPQPQQQYQQQAPQPYLQQNSGYGQIPQPPQQPQVSLFDKNGKFVLPGFYTKEQRLVLYKFLAYLLTSLFLTIAIILLTTYIYVPDFNKVFNYLPNNGETVKNTFDRYVSEVKLVYLVPIILFDIFILIRLYFVSLDFSLARKEKKIFLTQKFFPPTASNFIKKVYIKASLIHLNWNWFGGLYYLLILITILGLIVITYIINTWTTSGRDSINLIKTLELRVPNAEGSYTVVEDIKWTIVALASSVGVVFIFHISMFFCRKLKLTRIESYYIYNPVVDPNYLFNLKKSRNKRNLIISLIVLLLYIAIWAVIIYAVKKRRLPFFPLKKTM